MHVKPALAASAGGVNQVFVYGTLKNGEKNHGIMGPSRVLKGHTRVNGYILVDLGAFPAAVKVPNGGWFVYGEVYEVNDHVFKALDHLEGYPNFYSREVVDNDYYGKMWIYTLPREKYLVNGCRFVPGGRWVSGIQAYIFNEDRLAAGYEVNRPLIPAPSYNRPPIIVPEAPRARVVTETAQVGPGWEEA